MKFNVKIKGKGNSSPPSTITVVSQIGLIVLSFIWMLAVIKVFLLEGHHKINHDPLSLLSVSSGKTVPAFARSQLEINPVLLQGDEMRRMEFNRKSDGKRVELTTKAAKSIVPTSSEWAFIRASPDYKIAGNREHLQVKMTADAPKSDSSNEEHVIELTKSSDLAWPPVQPDGSILRTDGVDVMPVIGLKVPRFYMPAIGDDLNKVGSKVDGHDTIYLMIASYRDFQCRETITSAYMRSDHPERLYVGAVDQTVDGDIGCLDLDISCSVDATQPICMYKDQISVYHMDAMYATGPVTGETKILLLLNETLFI